MPKKKPKPAPKFKLRTADEVAEAAIQRFTDSAAAGAGFDSDAWKRAISAEARVFARELILAAAQVAGGPDAKDIMEALSSAAA